MIFFKLAETGKRKEYYWAQKFQKTNKKTDYFGHSLGNDEPIDSSLGKRLIGTPNLWGKP